MRKSNSRPVAPAGLPGSPPSVGATAGAGTDAESLLQLLPWGVVVLDAHGTVRHLNQQAAYWWGLPPAALLGQPLGPATAGTLPPDLQQALQHVARYLAPPPGEFFLPQQQQWITMTSARQADNWLVYWQDITEQKRQQTQHRAQQATGDALLRRTEAVACTGSYEIKLATGHYHFSDGLFWLFGEAPGAFTPSLALLEARSYPGEVAAAAQVVARALADGQPYQYQHRIYRADGQLRTLEVRGQVMGEVPGRAGQLLGLVQDVTEREQAAALRQSEARYRALFTSMAQGFCLLEKVATTPPEPSDFRYLAVNPAFVRHTGLADATGQTLRQLVPGVEASIVAVYDEVVASGEPRQFEEYVADLDLWIAAEVVPAAQPGYLSVLFSDVSARHRAEQTRREDAARQAYLLALSDALQLAAAAVEVQATVTHTARHYFQADHCYYGELVGDVMTIQQAATRPGLPPVAAGHSLSTLPIFSPPVAGNSPVVVADVDTAPGLDDDFRQHCRASHIGAYLHVPVTRHGQLVGLLGLAQGTPREWTTLEVTLLQETAERTWAAVARARAEDALHLSEEQFRLLVTATSDTVYRMGADWTQMEHLIGKNFLADTLGPSRTWMEEYIPADDLPQVQAAIAEAIRHQSTFELEHRVRRADGTVGWTHSRAIPMLDARGELTGWLGAARDVSLRKATEQQQLEFNTRLEQQVAERTQDLGESQARLQSVFDSVAIGLALLQAVRDAEGHLLDFEYVLVNPVAQAYDSEKTLVGRHYGELHPAVKLTPVFGQLAAVVETGRRADFEVHYTHEGYNHWYRLVGVKLGDGLLYAAEDITARKLLEQERTRSLALLQESEAVAGLGSWDYDLTTRALTWSDGLYHLLGRPVGSPVKPQLFLDAVLDDDRPAAARLMRTLSAGKRGFDAPLRLRVGSEVKTVRFKVVPLAAATGPPVRVLGVCLDVSDVQRLADENLTLKLDRHKELLLAILQAQEDERRRLAEVLHNSLGQVLYATKLHLDQLDTPALHALPALAGLQRQTGRLLAEAMRQTRTLAHELVPTSLAEFGLAVALREICRDLSTPQLRVECQTWGEAHALPQPLQVALFRLAQELAHNIVRHAGATQALLELETLPNWVSLRAEDNGHGFSQLDVAEGLGLRTVREAVALLGGTVAIDSSPEFGTHTRLRIPLPLFS